MKSKLMFRQGDVLVFKLPKRPKGYKAQKRDATNRVILAAGEVTGHHHAIHERHVCMLRAEGVSDAIITALDECQLVHEEHGTISIPRGIYGVRIQREWAGALSRRVED